MGGTTTSDLDDSNIPATVRGPAGHRAGQRDAGPSFVTATDTRPGAPRRRRGVVMAAGAAAAALLLIVPAPAAAQAVAETPTAATSSQPSRVRVYLDCQTRGCDQREFRTEIEYVDWVNEPSSADVHVILTSQSAGAGTEYVFDYVGRTAFDGVDERLRHTTADTDTRDEELRGLTRVLGIGLARYVALTGRAADLEISYDNGGSDGAEPALVQENDPWNYWVFRVGLNVDMDGEEQRSNQRFNASFNADRTTALWNVSLSFRGNRQRRDFTLSDGSVFNDHTDSWNASALMVRSISPHWSTGMQVDANTSTRQNRELGSRSAAALEWNLFPYEEANRRQLIVHYQVGYSHVRYEELTIFDKLQENLGDQRIAVSYNNRQPWGNVSLSADFSHYMHDFSKNSASFGGRVSFRVFRGLELNVNGGYDIIRDQLFLPAEDLSDEEILVQRRQLATGYEYNFGVGVSYRFGSIFNNVVNNRFPRSVRGDTGGGGPGRFF